AGAGQHPGPGRLHAHHHLVLVLAHLRPALGAGRGHHLAVARRRGAVGHVGRVDAAHGAETPGRRPGRLLRAVRRHAGRRQRHLHLLRGGRVRAARHAALAMIFGPTFAEMRDPSLLPAGLRARAAEARARPLDPLNLFNLSWKADGTGPFVVLPEGVTGVRAPIVVLSGRRFPTGSHKVGPAYSILVEKQLAGECAPGAHTLVFPSTGNFGIGGAWVGPRMGYRSLVVLPEEMSAERFEKIRGYGAAVVATPGSESNVKEIYDRVRELRREPANRVLNQFEELGNYRFHFHVTGAAALGGGGGA